MFTTKQLLMCGVVGVALLASGASARAAAIIGGSTLLDGSSANQLEAWLGQGPITLTNIFTETTGSTSADFHAAADGQGPTFSVMQVTRDDGTTTAIIGGYNPQSWKSTGLYNVTEAAEYRTSFLFNLTSSVKFNQISTGFYGKYQTWNNTAAGPTFGYGSDLYADSTLSNGSALARSFGESFGVSILNARPEDGSRFTIAGLEVFTISAGIATSVPEPLALSLFGVGLAGLSLATRRRRAA